MRSAPLYNFLGLFDPDTDVQGAEYLQESFASPEQMLSLYATPESTMDQDRRAYCEYLNEASGSTPDKYY